MEEKSIIAERRVAVRYTKLSALNALFENASIAAAVMVGAAILAVIVANSALWDGLHHFMETELVFNFGFVHLAMTFEKFVNDFLMAIFFLLVGVELKYEVTVGELKRPRQAMLPMLAAVGGVCVPALIYLALRGDAQLAGWAVPIATDIAFALGVMSLLGKRVAPQTKVFFQTLAIADDILAVLVLALFFGQAIDIVWLLASALVCLVLFGLNNMKVYSLKPYLLFGLILWICFFKAGIHATLSGVVLAFFLPAKSDVRLSSLHQWLSERASALDEVYDDEVHILGQSEFVDMAYEVEEIMHHVTPPLQRLDRALTKGVNFLILPLFAFVNAEVHLEAANFASLFFSPVFIAVFLGAFLGKPIGIISATWLLVKSRAAELPKAVDWLQITSVGLMGGMGFTMSILIANLAFSAPADILAAKLAILLASLAAGFTGALFLIVAQALRTRKTEDR